MNLGKAIRMVRVLSGMKQHQLAGLIGISPTSLSQIENGLKSPSKKNFVKICGALNTPESVFYILGIQVDDVPENRREVFSLIYPSIKTLALTIIFPDNHIDNQKKQHNEKVFTNQTIS